MSAATVNGGGVVVDGGGSGGASLPDTPAAVLLDLAHAGEVVSLDVSGNGTTVPYGTVVTEGLPSATGPMAPAGAVPLNDGAGGLVTSSDDVSAMLAATDNEAILTALGIAPTSGLDGARPAATLGAIYTATDTGVRYLGESDGAGIARWVVIGARGQEGRDTTAVLLDGAYADTSVNVVGSTVVSYAVVFAQRSIPTTAGVLLTVNPGTGTDGTYLDIGRDAGDRYLLGVYRYGFSSPAMPLTGATISGSPTALHCIAVTLDGATVRYSLDGAAVSTVSSGTGAATVGTAPLRLGKAGSTGTTAVDAWLASAVVWSTAVGDSDLAAVSGAARAAGATPGRIPAAAAVATEIARWHAGSERTGIATNAALGGSLGGNLTWTAAPSLVIR